uniref:S-phase kinase-associated protein 2 n=1 Tax=Lygus hesperus TaxID=30085 RepID=A0A0A9YR69_LYGHE
MASRKRSRVNNNNKYPPSKKAHTDARFEPEVLFDLGVDLLSDEEESEPTNIYNDYDKKIAKDFNERKILKPVPVRDIRYKRKSTDECSTKCDPFTALPDEILVKILWYLNHKSLISLSQTCRRFSLLCRDEVLWPRLNLTSRKFDVDAIGHILVLGVKVLRLNSAIFPSPIMSQNLTLKLETFVSKVKYLDLSYAWIKVDDLSLLLSKMRRLIKLSLESLNVNVDVMNQVVENQGLDTLNLAMSTGLDVECMNVLTSHLPKLEALNLAWTRLDCPALSVLCRNLTPNVKHLDISGTQLLLKNEDLVTLVRRCRSIESLDISDCLSISVNTFREIIKHLNRLKSLAISRSYQIEPRTLLEVKTLENLEVLAAYRLIPENLFDAVCDDLPNIRVNKNPFSVIARPTVGIRRTSIWEQPTNE